ncbi:MAG TPA: alpha/beta hydrolase [Flavobacteriaceae bacterium]|nr:alpha/beta hydrolase [Flavobacteriaceae bacterium]
MLKKISYICIAFYVFIVLGLYFFQEKIIFRPKKLAKNFSFTFATKFEEVHLKTNDNSLINALYFKVNGPKGVLLYFHGNKGNLERWGKIVAPYTSYGYDVFVIDYRGYGKNTDARTESKMYQDAQLAYDYVKQFFKEENISIYGRSLGCTFAAKVAKENKPKQLILEAPFYSLIDLAQHKLPFLPHRWLLKFKFETNNFIGKINCPIAIFHGDSDKMIPIESSQKLVETAGEKNIDFIILKNGTHHNISSFKIYKDTMSELLN